MEAIVDGQTIRREIDRQLGRLEFKRSGRAIPLDLRDNDVSAHRRDDGRLVYTIHSIEDFCPPLVSDNLIRLPEPIRKYFWVIQTDEIVFDERDIVASHRRSSEERRCPSL